MRQIYELTDKIEDIVNNSDELVGTVEVGNIDTHLNDDRTAFPAVLIDYGPATINNETCNVNMQVIIVERPTDNSAKDALNSTFAILSRIIAELQETVPDASYELQRDIQANYLWEDGAEGYAGWGATLSVTFANTSHNG